MSRIIVIDDSAHPRLEGCRILMNEEVQPEHLMDSHSANQLIERVAWAVCDASEAEQQAASDRASDPVRATSSAFRYSAFGS
jgi:hypothetical protein